MNAKQFLKQQAIEREAKIAKDNIECYLHGLLDELDGMIRVNEAFVNEGNPSVEVRANRRRWAKEVDTKILFARNFLANKLGAF